MCIKMTLSGASVAPIGFTRLKSDGASLGRTADVPTENAYLFHVQLLPAAVDMFIDGKRRPATTTAPGTTFLYDLRSNPVAEIYSSFDNVTQLTAHFSERVECCGNRVQHPKGGLPYQLIDIHEPEIAWVRQKTSRCAEGSVKGRVAMMIGPKLGLIVARHVDIGDDNGEKFFLVVIVAEPTTFRRDRVGLALHLPQGMDHLVKEHLVGLRAESPAGAAGRGCLRA